MRYFLSFAMLSLLGISESHAQTQLGGSIQGVWGYTQHQLEYSINNTDEDLYVIDRNGEVDATQVTSSYEPVEIENFLSPRVELFIGLNAGWISKDAKIFIGTMYSSNHLRYDVLYSHIVNEDPSIVASPNLTARVKYDEQYMGLSLGLEYTLWERLKVKPSFSISYMLNARSGTEQVVSFESFGFTEGYQLVLSPSRRSQSFPFPEGMELSLNLGYALADNIDFLLSVEKRVRNTETFGVNITDFATNEKTVSATIKNNPYRFGVGFAYYFKK